MNIDRNNYEMYFLLFVDNELSAEQRNAVEKFVAENTDLKAELELLMQTALPAEEVVFTAKDGLYKRELTPDKLQEQMLLQLDDELESGKVNSLAAQIAAHDDLKREWNILQQTKLDPNEMIVFKDKKSLYRREKDNVIPVYFWRAAAAILIIGAAIFVGISNFSGSESMKEIAGAKNNSLPSQKIIPSNQSTNGAKENKIHDQQPGDNLASVDAITNDTEKENNQDQPGKNLVSSSQKNKNIFPVTTRNSIKQKQDNNIVAVEKKNRGKEKQQKEHNNLPKPYFENINNQDRNKMVSSPVQDNIKTLKNKNEQEAQEEKAIAKADIKKPGKSIEDVELTGTDNAYAKNAVLDQEASETSSNSILFISEEKVSRSKFSGLFKKVKRVVARNTNINTGKNIKIAGFEIATR